MKTFGLFVIAAALAISTIAACAGGVSGHEPQAGSRQQPLSARRTLRPFSSEQELTSFLRELAEEHRREQERLRRESARRARATAPSSSPAASANNTSAGLTANQAVDEAESITNVQHAGVDEGGIVKLHGNHLVILRRGRLFTVAIGDSALRPISAVDAFGPEIDPRYTWYDEMLISDDTVVVIGYSYQRGGTEIGLFNIDRAGNLTYRSTYHLRSNDYYSSRNYSSRLIGNKLIFYTPLYFWPNAENPLAAFPAMRRWRRGATPEEFRRIVPATRVYRPAQPVRANSALALHTVTVCDLAGGEMACEATSMIGAPGRVFYVSPSSVYVWTTDWTYGESRSRPRSMLYRMPLDGSAPSALGVSGSPVDQFSFLESGDEYLNVLVRSNAAGDGMWSAEVAAGDVALLRVPLGYFSDGSEAAPSTSYRSLPKPAGYAFQNRFVGDYLLYGTGSGWGWPQQGVRSSLYAVRWAGGGAPAELSLAHGVDRIEVMGSDAVIVGTDGRNLHFTGVRLDDPPTVTRSYMRRDAAQGELRSHGFFYRPEGENSGLLGLPIRRGGRPGYEHLRQGSAAILFLRNDSLRLSELGELAARAERSADDGCRASCVDWYGNARPLFLRGRVFALLGYEIVEGTLTEGRIREARRINFAPQSQRASRR